MRREVQVKPAFADRYPSLEPGRWYTAAAVAGLVKGTRIITEGLDVEFSDRLLHPDHFEFRGGGPRRGGWMGVRSRRLDRHAALSGSSWSGRGRRPDWGGEFS
jgi:hypothetical protein